MRPVLISVSHSGLAFCRLLSTPMPSRTGGLQRKPVTPGAYFDGALGEILPYDRVRDAAEPDARFSVYNQCCRGGDWRLGPRGR
jgi:hypothetical protein